MRTSRFTTRARQAMEAVFGPKLAVLAEHEDESNFGGALVLFQVGRARIEVRRERGELLSEVRVPDPSVPDAFATVHERFGEDTDAHLMELAELIRQRL